MGGVLDGYLARFRPADAAETRCVERLAACDWREDRLERLEAETLFAGRGDTHEPDPRLGWSRTLPRYEAAIRRDREAALEQLDTLRASRPRLPDSPTAPTPPGCAGWPTGSSAGSRRHHARATRPNPSRAVDGARARPRSAGHRRGSTPVAERRHARTRAPPRSHRQAPSPGPSAVIDLVRPAAPATATVRPSSTAAGALL